MIHFNSKPTCYLFWPQQWYSEQVTVTKISFASMASCGRGTTAAAGVPHWYLLNKKAKYIDYYSSFHLTKRIRLLRQSGNFSMSIRISLIPNYSQQTLKHHMGICVMVLLNKILKGFIGRQRIGSIQQF